MSRVEIHLDGQRIVRIDHATEMHWTEALVDAGYLSRADESVWGQPETQLDGSTLYPSRRKSPISLRVWS